VKDLATRNEIVRCDSSGRLYSFHVPSRALLAATTPSTLWHRRLGHLGVEALSHLVPCNKRELEPLCHACQLGRHVRQPFVSSRSRAVKNFDLLHCDLWTSPVPSISGYKYYLVILDDCSHFTWTFPLRLKSDNFQTISQFFAYVATQFGTSVKTVQCDNGREFDNLASRQFFSPRVLPCACPVLTHHPKMVELSALSVLLTISCVLLCFRLAFLHHIGLRLLVQLRIF